jgi:adenylate cyclase
MGSAQRLNYSVLGDAVNLAARLEGQSKTYGVDNVIGESTMQGVSDFALLELDLIQVKGKTVPVRVFTVLGDEKMAAEADFQGFRAHHERMIEAYRRQDWAAADAEIEASRPYAARFGVQGLLELYLDRVEDLRQHPPGPDWDGAYVAKTK